MKAFCISLLFRASALALKVATALHRRGSRLAELPPPDITRSETRVRDVVRYMDDFDAAEITYKVPGYHLVVTRVNDRLHEQLITQHPILN